MPRDAQEVEIVVPRGAQVVKFGLPMCPEVKFKIPRGSKDVKFGVH